MDNENYKQLGKTTERKIGKTVFTVRAFSNKSATKTAQDLLIEIAEKRIQDDIENGDFYKKLVNE